MRNKWRRVSVAAALDRRGPAIDDTEPKGGNRPVRATLRLLIVAGVLLLLLSEVGAGSVKRIVVDLSENRLTAYQGGAVVLRAPAILGTASHPVTSGEYTVVGKARRVNGHIGPDATIMPWVLNLENGASIHASYCKRRMGCVMTHNAVSLPNRAAADLWQWADVGTPVLVRE